MAVWLGSLFRWIGSCVIFGQTEYCFFGPKKLFITAPHITKRKQPSECFSRLALDFREFLEFVPISIKNGSQPIRIEGGFVAF